MPIPRQCRRHITRFFESIKQPTIERYKTDWTTIIPKSDHETLNRWRFAYCTVHTPWENSCDQYNRFKHTYEDQEYPALVRLLKDSGGGMWDIKAYGIAILHYLWQIQSPLFDKPTRKWQAFRNTIRNNLPKLGLAKTSFAIEMLYPHDAQVICIDRHMFKAFGWEDVDRVCSDAQYHYYENYWVDISNEYNLAPVISRNLFWDIIQQQDSSMYWAKHL
jgi:hypothetical protein